MVELNTRPPIQIWSPVIPRHIYDDVVYRRDLFRAEVSYKRENFIWLNPEAEKIGKWKENYGTVTFYNMIVPSDTTNVIVVYNIDELGNIFPHILGFDRIKKGLYLEWLKSELKIDPENEPFEMEFRKISEKYAYTEKINIEPGIAYINCYSNIDNYWKANLEKIVPGKIISELKSNKDLCFQIVWPEHFTHIFPTGGGIYTLYNFYLMKKYLKLSINNKDAITRAVGSLVASFVSKTKSTISRSWFIPKLYSKITDELIEVQGKFNLEFNSTKEAISSIKLGKRIREKVDIKRIYGWIGYFWWEFYQDILKHTTIKFCKNCGQIISGGRQDRIYCTKEENYDCWKSRAALRQKKKYRKDKKNPIY